MPRAYPCSIAISRYVRLGTDTDLTSVRRRVFHHIYLLVTQASLRPVFLEPGSRMFLLRYLLITSHSDSVPLVDYSNHREAPPRRARTRCNVAPPSRLYSAAVLSSALYHYAVTSVKSQPSHPTLVLLFLCWGVRLHLLSTKDQTLLDGRNAFLLFDALLYPRNLGRLV